MLLFGVKPVEPIYTIGVVGALSVAEFLSDFVLTDGLETSSNMEYEDGAVRLICRQGDHWGVKGVNLLPPAPAQHCVFDFDMMYAATWPTVAAEDQGKLMMLSGTADGADGTTGGERATGYNGFSVRTQFRTESDGKIPMCFYVYHVDMPDDYGEKFDWKIRGGGMVRATWYHVKIYMKMNDPTAANGVIAAWVDGFPAFRKSDMRFRLSADALPGIDRFQPTLYWGGSAVPAVDAAVHVKNLTVLWG